MNINKKIKSLIWPIIYLVLTAMVVVSFSVGFKARYFQPIYISGSSMQPTLNQIEDNDGTWHHYGYIDTDKGAIKNLKRFNIITTFYPFSSFGDYTKPFNPNGENVVSENASYKIKRVYAFPGEQFKFDISFDEVKNTNVLDFYVKTAEETDWGKPLEIPFERKINFNRNGNPDYYRYESPVLGENQYFCMGDNYTVSADCYSETKSTGNFSPIYFENIQGVLIAIEGICKINNVSGEGVGILDTFSNYVRKPYKTPIYYI